LTKAGPTLAFYLDGEFVKSTAGAGNTASIGPWHLMNNGAVPDQFTTGEADDVAIYGRALDAGEVREHYRLGRGDA
jgi:hypothetical protein